MKINLKPFPDSLQTFIKRDFDLQYKSILACLTRTTSNLLIKTELFRKPASYEDLYAVYRRSLLSEAVSLFTIPDGNYVDCYVEFPAFNTNLRIDVGSLVTAEILEKYGIDEVRSWYLYVINSLTCFHQSNTYFFHIDDEQMLEDAFRRYSDGTAASVGDFHIFQNLLARIGASELDAYSPANTVSFDCDKGTIQAGDYISGRDSYEVDLRNMDMEGLREKYYDLFVFLLMHQDFVGADTETTGLDVFFSELVSLGLSFNNRFGFYLSYTHESPKQATLAIGEAPYLKKIALKGHAFGIKNYQRFLSEVGDSAKNISKKALLKIVNRMRDMETVWHNAKFDFNILLTWTGIRLPIYMDTLLAYYVAMPGYDDLARDKKGLKFLVTKELGVPDWKVDLKDYRFSTKDVAAAYNVRDTCYMLGLAFKIGPEVTNVWDLFMLEMNFLPVLIEAERAGIDLDAAKLVEIEATLVEKMKAIEQSYEAKYMHYVEELGIEEPLDFNINSTAHLKVLFFDLMKVVPSKKCTTCGKIHAEEHTKCTNERCTNFGHEGSAPLKHATPTGELSLDKFALKDLEDRGIELVGDLMEYRMAGKLVSSYCNLDTKRSKYDGRIHPTYNQAVTATGRLSSSNPNF